jgi:hypothetical protein
MSWVVELLPLFIVRFIASCMEAGELDDNGLDFVEVAPRVWVKVYEKR